MAKLEEAAKAPRPKQSFTEWLKSKKPAPIPGPFFQWNFPMHIVRLILLIKFAQINLYNADEQVWFAMLPILIPLVLVAVPTRFALSTKHSNKRVKLLESDEESMTRRLITAWKAMERGAEDAVKDIVEQGLLPTTGGDGNGNGNGNPLGVYSEGDSTPILYGGSTPVRSQSPSNSYSQAAPTKPKSQPLLTDTQKKIIKNLNKLPNLSKHVAFFDSVRNSHGTIVCRSVDVMEQHRQGAGILKSWADGMVL